MKFRSDGSIQSGAVPTYANVNSRLDHGLYRCMVTKVIFTDTGINITKSSRSLRVLYEVIILGGLASGQILSNCRLASTLGGNNSFYERTLKASEGPITGQRLSSKDGDIVFVQFIQGNQDYPVIIALDQGNDVFGKIGVIEADSPRSIKEYNGVRETIDNTGTWTLERKGGTAQPSVGGFTPNSEAESSLKLDADEKFTREFKSGLVVTEDGKNDSVSMTTNSGVSVLIDGASNKITLTKGSTIIELDGNSDKISLKGGFVDLGSSVSDFAVLFTELATAFNQHSHNAPQAPTGVLPTSPPLAPLLQTVGSITVKVQS